MQPQFLLRIEGLVAGGGATALLFVGGWYTGTDIATAAALIWAAHIGVDRLFGFGLKYGGAEFGDTHSQRV